MRASTPLLVLGLSAAALALAGCSGGGSGVTTASVLDGATGAGGSDIAPIKADDPNARTIQVAWTSARAQRCGFVFDQAKLKASFLASEAARVGPTGAGANTERVYDQTFTTISAKIKSEADYCSRSKTAEVRQDLQRHLAGNYEPNLPGTGAKKPGGGFLDALVSDEPSKPFDASTFWGDLKAKQDGAKGAQKTPE